MEEPKPMNSPSGVLPGTGEEVSVVAMKIIKLHLKYSEGCIEAVKKMPSPNFNKEQCGFLVDKLEVVVQAAKSFFEVSRPNHCGPDSSWNATKWVGIFKLLLVLGKQIEDFIVECSKSAWVEAAMTLIDVAEYVSSLGFNLELCKVLFMEGECAAMQCGLNSVEVGNLYKAEVETVKLMAIVDKEYLFEKVKSASDASGLAKHLLERLHLNPTCAEGNIRGKLFGWVKLDTSAEQQLGKGSSATIYKATLFGTPVAQKTFYGPKNYSFMREVDILSQLCHPNITSMFASAMNKRSCSIIMELMDCDLLALIRGRCGEQSDCPPFSLFESLDLMLQISEGVNYLHTKRIVHRDLKSNNILVKVMRAADLETGYLQAKVVDFGLSKTKEMSASFSCMTYNQGTPRWMAPEVMRPGVDDPNCIVSSEAVMRPGVDDANCVASSEAVMRSSVDDPDCIASSEAMLNYKFKCDVYSFAMVCYEILTGELPFKDKCSAIKIEELVLKGERPELPIDCPALLKALIEKCWIGNPKDRPTFGTICSTLQYLKYLFIRGDISPEGSEARLDHTLSEGSRWLTEVVTSKCLSTAKVEVPSSSVSKREQVVDVSPIVISPLAAPSGAAGGWVRFFSKDRFKAWFPDRRQYFRTYEDFKATTSAFPTMEKLESMNDLTQEEVNAATMKIIKSRLKSSQGCIEAVKKMPSPNFNKEQCGYLVNKLEVVVQVARSFFKVSRSNHCGPDSSWNVTKWVGIFKLLLVLGKQIEDFIVECSKSAWVEAAMTLVNVAEYVSSLGFNLELCKVLFMEGECAAMQRGLNSVEVDNRFKAEVKMAKLMAIVDKEYLLKKVTLASNASDLAKHLLERLLLNPTCAEGNTHGKLFDWVKSDTSREVLGRGAFATVYKATLFGTPVAQKTFYGPKNYSFMREVDILSQLCHPNIISMFASTINKRSCSIIMELMDCDLLALIQRRCGERSDSPPFSLFESLDLMLQISEGVNYLHTKRIVHRDLKSNNILVKVVRAAKFETGYVQSKVAGFGISRTSETSASFSSMTLNVGTTRWMAPELMSLPMDDPGCVASSEAVPNYIFKCDVYSFAMVCYEILTGEVPFNKHTPKKVKQLVLKGERLELPTGCPALLKALIEKCWIGNPRERPTFGTICLTLRYLKYLFMIGDITLEGSEARLDHTLLDG